MKTSNSLSKSVIDIVAMACLFSYSVYFTLSFFSPFLNITVYFYEPNMLVWAVEIILFMFSMVYAVFRMWEIVGNYQS